ncbi:MAG: rhodanese-like domain-containing protein [Sulfurovum sp.]|nr:rhodanese-like domain-containing protein [Sulfurovum sp.]
MQKLLEQHDVNSEELEILLDAREKGEVDFLLVDVREKMEYDEGHVKGVDMLKPTTSFQEWAHELLTQTKDKKVIFTCRTGSRSAQVQQVFKENGHDGDINHYGGIVTYYGNIER